MTAVHPGHRGRPHLPGAPGRPPRRLPREPVGVALVALTPVRRRTQRRTVVSIWSHARSSRLCSWDSSRRGSSATTTSSVRQVRDFEQALPVLSDLVADVLQVGAVRRVAVLVSDALREPGRSRACHEASRTPLSPVFGDLLDGASAYTSRLGTSASDPRTTTANREATEPTCRIAGNGPERLRGPGAGVPHRNSRRRPGSTCPSPAAAAADAAGTIAPPSSPALSALHGSDRGGGSRRPGPVMVAVLLAAVEPSKGADQPASAKRTRE